MSTFSPKAHLQNLTLRNQRLLSNDLKAIPEEKQNHCPGGCARSAVYMVAECGAVNGMVAKALCGEEIHRPPHEEREAFLRSFDTADKALLFLEKETQSLLSAIEALDEDTFGEVIPTPIGERTRFGLAELPAFHMGYHDGQLNYIQTLHGDDEMHW